MRKSNFLNVFNIATALYLLETGADYAEINDDHVAIVAYDGTVWACMPNGVHLDDATMVQRLV